MTHSTAQVSRVAQIVVAWYPGWEEVKIEKWEEKNHPQELKMVFLH